MQKDIGNEFNEILINFKDYVKKIEYYNNAIALLHWDLSTKIPEKGIKERSNLIALLSSESFRLTTSDKMESFIDYFVKEENNNKLDSIMRGVVRETKKNYDRFKKIPEEKYRDYVQLTSEAQSIWEKAKNNDDFTLFQPYLEKIIKYNIEFTELWGYDDNRYNALLDNYEPGMTVKKLDNIFTELRKSIVSLLSRIEDSNTKPVNKLSGRQFDIRKQEKICKKLLEEIGFDFSSGRLDESEHPFTIDITAGDVRLTTHYYPENLSSALFSSLHEGGHGLYEQNINEELIGTPLCTGTSMGIHESQSRFWENIIGRSYRFWNHYFSELKELFPEELKDISLDDFHSSINLIKPSLIRIEADELTYNLHIIIRYEIEKALINEELAVSELPEVWNKKMEEYLGIVPDNNKEGVLQDVHWSSGLIGYFPSYTLGNIYAAQFYYTIKKEIQDFDELVNKGDLGKITEWLKDRIHKHGKLLTPPEIIKNVTGEDSNSKYLIKYLEDKYSAVYNI
ncbi:MAG: carboxypeptidase M32 [Halanaerobiales bacterium]